MSLQKVNNFENSTWADRYGKKNNKTHRQGSLFWECPYFDTKVVACIKTGSEKKITGLMTFLR